MLDGEAYFYIFEGYSILYKQHPNWNGGSIFVYVKKPNEASITNLNFVTDLFEHHKLTKQLC